jgi:geranylgeranyl pyrophosphate synthase
VLCSLTCVRVIAGGKRWRSVLVLLIGEALGGDMDLVKDFVTISETVHNGTLAIDDIEDSSQFRRGKECLHLIYGVDIAVNAGNAMYYMPLLVLRERANAIGAERLVRCYEVYSQEMINLHFGQGMDIYWHSGKGSVDPTIKQYLQMCAFKTGTLARMSAKLSALVSGANEETVNAVGRFAEAIGVAFQIQDDILNISKGALADLKGWGEDIHEGKRTIMVLDAFAKGTPEQSARLRQILKEKPDLGDARIAEAIGIINATNSIEFAKVAARDLAKEAWAAVEPKLPESEAKRKLKAFAYYLIEREI